MSIIVITQILSNPIFFGVAGKTFTEKKLVFKSLPIQFLEGVTEEYPMNFKRFGKKHSQSISEFFFLQNQTTIHYKHLHNANAYVAKA